MVPIKVANSIDDVRFGELIPLSKFSTPGPTTTHKDRIYLEESNRPNSMGHSSREESWRKEFKGIIVGDRCYRKMRDWFGERGEHLTTYI